MVQTICAPMSHKLSTIGYLNAAFKEDRLIIWSSGVSNITERRSTLVRESSQHLVQTLKTNTLQEPLAIRS